MISALRLAGGAFLFAAFIYFAAFAFALTS